MDNIQIMREAIICFGEEQQQFKAIEELSELVVELAKDLNGLPSNILEELADVEIMLEQVKMVLKITPEHLEEVKCQKLLRLSERMKKIEMDKATSVMESITPVEGASRAVHKCAHCGKLFGMRFINYSSSNVQYFNACVHQMSSNASSTPILQDIR